MKIVPAIDLRGGHCVALTQGDPDQETQYDGDPVARARSFADAGAKLLHVVDLDGAFGTGENRKAIGEICAAVDIPVEVGGGLRSDDDVRSVLRSGASFVVLGTMLIEDPETSRKLIDEFGEKIVAGVDARGVHVAIRGWKSTSPLGRDPFVRELAKWGLQRIVFTEIERDGTGTGYDVEALASVASLTPMRVTASGGAKTIDDVHALIAGVPPNVDMAIVGRALYDGTMNLAEAIASLSSPPPSA
ncbi:MAG TPA: 1-(5-phosphoribosyl)-5-[(5-phosphoribosylamino)methylideneamino] imidazole-4-carboxamide isomerase [Candidatus Acidoferrales bacterium]|nr:1-(5-phosphoribosyl)-5-[(5-phosphoribosylamino)methylideneamino] imidazole-4-carboxamide isomerase [Candidatus Acidoferrales bacterium]